LTLKLDAVKLTFKSMLGLSPRVMAFQDQHAVATTLYKKAKGAVVFKGSHS
jgi:hypothetical protein